MITIILLCCYCYCYDYYYIVVPLLLLLWLLLYCFVVIVIVMVTIILLCRYCYGYYYIVLLLMLLLWLLLYCCVIFIAAIVTVVSHLLVLSEHKVLIAKTCNMACQNACCSMAVIRNGNWVLCTVNTFFVCSFYFRKFHERFNNAKIFAHKLVKIIHCTLWVISLLAKINGC